MNDIFIYDVFTSVKFGGNQAAVVLLENKISKKNKQLFAKELNFSETVFVSSMDKSKWKLEYFTPKEEIDLCGHATIAAVYALFDNKKLGDKNKIKIETKVGILNIYLEKNKNELLDVWMEQDKGKISFEIPISKEEILSSLSLKIEDLNNDIPIFKSYSGLWDLFIPLNSKEAVDKIISKEEKVKEISKKLSVISFHPFFLKEKEAYVRNFAPSVDIPEEAATGTSNGALAFALERLSFLKKEVELVCYQGESMQRLSTILAKISKEGDILIGGKAVKVLEGKI